MESDEDIRLLRQLLRTDDNRNIVQLGKYNVNIAEGKGDTHIGDRIYQGADSEAIKEALRFVIQEKRKAQRSRSEKLLLKQVKEEVIARLKQSLHNAVLINLGKEAQPEQIKPPWSSDIKIGDKLSELIPCDTSILEVFDQEEIAGKLLILGEPGAGKTTTMLDLAKSLIIRAEQDAEYPVPVLFNLSTWKYRKHSILEWLVVELKSKYGVRKDIATKWLDEVKLLPMLDGLDELESVLQEPCVRKINEYLQSDSRPQYLVVCCRLEEYETVVRDKWEKDREKNSKENLLKQETRLFLNRAIQLHPLTDEQIKKYLLGFNQIEVWRILRSEIDLLSLFKTPLFLSILSFISFYKTFSLQDWQKLNSEEERKNYLFEAYWEAAINREIITPQMNLKGLKSLTYHKKDPPSDSQTKRWLAFLAKQLQKMSQTEFLIENMQPCYFVNRYQKRIFGIGVGFSIGLISGVSTAMIVGVFKTSGIEKLFLALFFGIGAGIINGQYKTIQTIETLSWSWSEVFRNVFIGPYFGMLNGIICGKDIETKKKPNQGIYKSAANSFKIGSIIGLIGILLGGLSFGTGLGLIFWLRFGGTACVQHFMLRLILRLNDYVPVYYVHFLDYCVERNFLQRVGGKYRFIHKLLQEHFSHITLGK